MAIKVGRWDCSVCGQKGNLGPEKQCKSCGSARPENVKFYLTSDAEIVIDQNKLKEAKSGADWVCSYCKSHNKATETHCHTCGNDREVADGDKSLQQKENYFDGRHLQNKPITLNNSKKSKLKLGAKIGLAVVALLVLFPLSTLFTKEIEVEVTGFEWERVIELEEYKEVLEEDWKIPNGGRQVESYRALHHYDEIPTGTVTKTRTVEEQVGTESVKVGERDLGNGYFEDIYEEKPIYETREETYEETVYKKEAVYQTKYKYMIFKWKEMKPLKTTAKDRTPKWAELPNNQNKTREKSKKETYWVILNVEGEENKDEISFQKWNLIKKGDKLKAKKSLIYGVFIGLKEK